MTRTYKYNSRLTGFFDFAAEWPFRLRRKIPRQSPFMLSAGWSKVSYHQPPPRVIDAKDDDAFTAASIIVRRRRLFITGVRCQRFSSTTLIRQWADGDTVYYSSERVRQAARRSFMLARSNCSSQTISFPLMQMTILISPFQDGLIDDKTGRRGGRGRGVRRRGISHTSHFDISGQRQYLLPFTHSACISCRAAVMERSRQFQ